MYISFISVSTTTTTQSPSPCVVKYNRTTLTHNYCTSVNEVEVGSCSGACQSSASFLLEAPFYNKDCSCCTPIEFDSVNVTMQCYRGQSTIKFMRIKACSCRPCEEVLSKTNATDLPVVDDDGASTSSRRKRRSLSEMLYDFFSW